MLQTIETMELAGWLSIRTERVLRLIRASPLRNVLLAVVFCAFLYLFWLPVAWAFGDRKVISRQLISGSDVDAIQHFAGSKECNITQKFIYSAPWLASSGISPFCSDRVTLLEALNAGARSGLDKPFIGKGCTYRWYSTAEICMILERFNSVTFIGDYLAQSVYTAFTILLREDLALGGLQQSDMNFRDQEDCTCDNQFVSSACLSFAVKSFANVKEMESTTQESTSYFCNRISHAYIPFSTIPASSLAVTTFKALTYQRPNPWKPSPMIFSYAHGSLLDVSTTAMALDEWTALAFFAYRNIPMLFLGPRSSTPGTDPGASLRYYEEIAPIARAKHFDVLSFYNLTLETEMVEEKDFGERVALVEAMMIINWLSKVDSS